MLEKWYGLDAAANIKNAEAFEICEYGRQPDEATIKPYFLCWVGPLQP